MAKELIRTSIMNLTMHQWLIVKDIEKGGFINVEPKELMELIGFDGGMFFIDIANDREKRFIIKFYRIGRRTMKRNT